MDSAFAQEGAKQTESPSIIGGIGVAPSFAVQQEWNDNIFVQNSHAASDWITHLSPSLILKNTSQNYPVKLSAKMHQRLFATYEDENTTDATLHIEGSVPIRRHHTLHAEAGYYYGYEGRESESSLQQLDKPTRYNRIWGGIGSQHTMGRYTVKPYLETEVWRWQNNQTQAGSRVVQDDRDRMESTAGMEVAYRVNESTAVLSSLEGSFTHYQRQEYNTGSSKYDGRDRDSQGVEALVGITYKVTGKTDLEIALGGMQKQFDHTDDKTITAATGHLSLKWQATGLTKISAHYDRSIENTTQNASAYIRDEASLRIDHELKRHINLFADVTGGYNDYLSGSGSAKTWALGAGIAYQWRDGITATAQYVYDRRDSENISTSYRNDFDRNRFQIGVQFLF